MISVGVSDTVWILPPTRALWIPAGVDHTTSAVAASALHSLFLRPERSPVWWSRPTALAVLPLLAALIPHLSRELPDAARTRAEAVLFDLLTPAPVATVDLRWPIDDRARQVADALAANPADNRGIEAWGRLVGASSRTLTRVFRAETGISVGRWRTRLRLRAALALLAEGAPVAHRVGFQAPSAFVASFRRELEITPAQCFAL